MSNDKEVIQKLLKIAENQQKIITKIAQNLATQPMTGGASSWSDVTDEVAAKLATIPGAKGYSIQNAEVGAQSGTLRGNILTPKNDENFYDVIKALKGMLAGNSLTTSDGQSVKVSTNPKDVSFTGMS